MDGRVLLLQSRPGFAQGQMMRLAAPRNPLDPYDHLVQRPSFPEGAIRQPVPTDPQRIQGLFNIWSSPVGKKNLYSVKDVIIALLDPFKSE